jgi:hypothetical protein
VKYVEDFTDEPADGYGDRNQETSYAECDTVAWLKAGGPRSARVDKVLTEPHQPGREYVNFGIRY